MIVNRRTFKVTDPDKAVALLKGPNDYLGTLPTFRIYSSNIGTWNLVVLEQEFENLTEYEKFWDNFSKAPETPALMEEWQKVTLPGGTNEIWNLEE